jgi:hypothetical protein
MAEAGGLSERERAAREIVADYLAQLQPDATIWSSPLIELHPDLAAEIETVLREACQMRGVIEEAHPSPAGVDGEQERSTDCPASTAPGQSVGPSAIGKYHVMAELGHGGQADVYKAYDPSAPQRIVAIKWFRDPVSSDGQAAWLRDSLPLTALDDPGIVRLYDVGIYDSRPYLVLEFVEGVSPSVAVSQASDPIRRAVEIVADATAIVQRMHKQGVQHRDLKPGNLVIDVHDRVRVLDFGLGSLDRVGSPTLPQQLGVTGTPEYMAPEQARGEADRIDHRTDVFGLGATAYALLTGRPPYRGKDGLATVKLATEAHFPLPRELYPRIPPALEYIVCKALNADPSRRYQSAAELEAAFRSFLARCPRKRWILAVAAGLALLVGFGGILWNNRDPATSAPDAETVPERLDGRLDMRVWSEVEGSPKRGLPIDDPAAVPVRNGELVHLHAQLNAPARLYLLWIGSDGRIQRLHPPSVTTTAELRELHSPEAFDLGWPIDGLPGAETAVLLATRRPLDADFDWKSLEITLRPPSQWDPQDVVRLDVNATRSALRSVGPKPELIQDPLLQFLEQLRPHFEVIKAVRFGHVE